LLPEIKIDELQKRQETHNKKYNCQNKTVYEEAKSKNSKEAKNTL